MEHIFIPALALLVVIGTLLFVNSKIKKTQASNNIENYRSTDEAGCQETHQQFWAKGYFGTSDNYCPICEAVR